MFIFTLKHPQPTQTDFYYQMVNYYLTSHFKQFGINLKFKFSLVCISNEKDFFSCIDCQLKATAHEIL